jgi:CheY-like chemotaxis protein
MTENKATILCIDDETGVLLTRRLLLEKKGYRVLTAQSGAEGIRLFQSEPVDAVILDYWMTGMNGLMVARQLKQLSPHIPIIFVSAWGTLLDETVGLSETWIMKGEDPDYLLGKLSQTLTKAKTPEQSA